VLSYRARNATSVPLESGAAEVDRAIERAGDDHGSGCVDAHVRDR
jgi:hypothetical protein